MNLKIFFSPSAKGLGSASVRRAVMMLLVMMLTTIGAWAGNVTVTSATTAWTDGNTYKVTSNVTITERITVTGDVTLYLGAGCTLTAEKGITVVGGDGAGNKVAGKPNGNANSLTIEGTGTLNADMSKGGTVARNDQLNAAAIGGGLYNESNTDYLSWCGNITINGGTVYAVSYQASGIGCSAIFTHVENSGGTITINGGNVTAISKQDFCAGIGGSFLSEAGTITINGGTVTAEAYGVESQYSAPDPGAAIGNGGITWSDRDGGGGTITITGGQITATKGYYGIGFGKYHGNVTMTINLGWSAATDFIDAKNLNGTVNFNKPFVADGEDYTELKASSFNGKKMVPTDYMVTFDAGASNSTYNPIGVKDGTAINAPANDPVPTDATLAFMGWTTDGTTPYDFGSVVTSDLTLTAFYKLDFTVNNVQPLYNYTGSAIDIGYTVTDAANGSALTSPTDYVATIKNAENEVVTEVTEKGIYTLTVTGQGTFEGIVKTCEFPVDNVVTLDGYDFIDLGDGTYGICNAALLENLAAYTNTNGDNTTNKTFKLTHDIAFDAKQSNNHTSIGTWGNLFNGTFDGQGHTVSGIRINRANGENIGLFGRTSGKSTVKRVKMSNAVIAGFSNVGGIAGWNIGSVTDCMADATVSVGASKNNAYNIGGIVGRNSGTISGCASAATVTGNGFANVKPCGGIVGWNIDGTLTSSIYTGSSVFVYGAGIDFGYLVGEESSDGTITNCYHTGTNTKTYGIYTNNSSETMYTSYSSGHARTINAGEYVTILGFTGTATEYTTSGITTSEDCPGMLFANKYYATRNETIYLLLTAERPGFVFNGYSLTWNNNSQGLTRRGNGWSVTMPYEDVAVTISSSWFNPDDFSVNTAGTEYTIKNAVGWGVFCDLLADNTKGYFTGKTVKLDDDISVTRTAGSSGHDFTGTFDGGGKTLTVSYENTGDNTMTAPISYVDGATIQNLVVDGSITGTAFRAAGVIGETGDSTSHITNCISSVNIRSGRYTGGFSIGGNVEIEGCVFNGTINGTARSGGFVGYSNSKLKITNSLFAPQSGSSIVGGTFYFNGGGEITPSNSYYTQTLGTAQGRKAYVLADAPTNLGAEVSDVSYTVLTAYENGILFDGKYYVALEAMTLADVPTLVSLILNGNTDEVGDIDGDARLSLADVTALVNLLR